MDHLNKALYNTENITQCISWITLDPLITDWRNITWLVLKHSFKKINQPINHKHYLFLHISYLCFIVDVDSCEKWTPVIPWAVLFP